MSVWSPKITSKPPTLLAKSMSSPIGAPFEKPRRPKCVIATTTWAPARLAAAFALFAEE